MATELRLLSQRIVSHNPATGETLGSFPCATEEEIRTAVERARVAQPAWAARKVSERTAILRSFQRLLTARKADVASLITRECGKPYVESLSTEVLIALDAARYCIETASEFLRDEPVRHGNLLVKAKRARVIREPHGVIGIISPWNYPFSTPATEVMGALVAGNAVILKPSEFTPLAAQQLHSLLIEAGVPEDVFQVMHGEGATGAALVESGADKIIFTGSVATGKRVAHTAAQRLVPVVLELGGKDPMIVLDDADVEVASKAAVWGAFMNAGQTCLSVERCYVHRKIFDTFLQAVVRRTKALRVGNGMDGSTDMGPLINARQMHLVESQIQDAKARGACVVTGGHRLPNLGPNFFAPTVLTAVDHSMPVMREESFGPILPIMSFENDNQAVRMANDSEFGLAASVWTRDRKRGHALARRIAAGTVMINDVITSFAISEAPHGGIKASGIGRTHGHFGMEEMVRVKYVDSDLLPNWAKAWWYPYSGKFAAQLESMIDFLFGRGLLHRSRAGLKAAPAFPRNIRDGAEPRPE